MTFRISSVLLAASIASACAPATQAIIPTTPHAAQQQSDCCLAVMLPGKGDEGESYSTNQVVQRFQQVEPNLEVVTVDAHFGYYKERVLLPQLYEVVLKPAVDRGVTSIWLVGTSMGGIGALLTAQEYPELIDGIVLFAPYLGPRGTLTSIRDAGGVAAWEPPKNDSSWDISLWTWIKGYTTGEDRPPIILAYGEQDRGAEAHVLLAEILPEANVFHIPGGHGWKVWNPLWDDVLAKWPLLAPTGALGP